MKVFKSEAEKLPIVVMATFAGVWLSQSGLLFGQTNDIAKIDWMSAIVPASMFLLALLVVTFSMPRVIVTSHAMMLKALWGMQTISTIPYSAIQKVSIQVVGESAQIFHDVWKGLTLLSSKAKPIVLRWYKVGSMTLTFRYRRFTTQNKSIHKLLI